MCRKYIDKSHYFMFSIDTECSKVQACCLLKQANRLLHERQTDEQTGTGTGTAVLPRQTNTLKCDRQTAEQTCTEGIPMCHLYTRQHKNIFTSAIYSFNF